MIALYSGHFVCTKTDAECPQITKVDTSNWTEELRDAEMNKYRSHLERLASSWSQQDTETQLNEMFRFRVDLARSYDLAGPDPLILQSAELMTKAPFVSIANHHLLRHN